MRSNLRYLSLSLLLALGCSTTRDVELRHATVDQILYVRPGYPGKLTNRACLKYDGDQCVKPEVKEYDLADPQVRKDLNALGFVCNLGGKRYKICLDKPGYCRRDFNRKCFLGICGKRYLVSEKYVLAVKRHEFLLDAQTKCFSEDSYSWGDL